MVETDKKEIQKEANGAKIQQSDITLLSEYLWIEALIKFRINELCGIEQDPNLPQIPKFRKVFILTSMNSSAYKLMPWNALH